MAPPFHENGQMFHYLRPGRKSHLLMLCTCQKLNNNDKTKKTQSLRYSIANDAQFTYLRCWWCTVLIIYGVFLTIDTHKAKNSKPSIWPLLNEIRVIFWQLCISRPSFSVMRKLTTVLQINDQLNRK